MKKSLFIFAAAALALTACTSEDDVVQSTAQKQATADVLSFDVYMPQVSKVATRAGSPTGVMTTEKLKGTDKGFGVFAFHHDNSVYGSTLTPNFMYNEHVYWNNGWIYSPLKYWPNETGQDSQTTDGPAISEDTPSNRIDRVSFFAYAPYVSTGTSKTLDTKATNMELNIGASNKISAYEKAETKGILRISSETYAGDPKIEWGVSADFDNNVDLLWGVAPSGMNYQSVNPTKYITTTYGRPLINLMKPDKDQRIKFLFQHALSRIGLSVVSAIDQIAAGDDGGIFTKDGGKTRVLIEEVRVWGNFGINGVLNLNNSEVNVANWEEASVNRIASTAADPLFRFDNGTAVSPLVANGYIAPDLRYDATTISNIASGSKTFSDLHTGVLQKEEALLASGADLNKVATDLTYQYGKKLYTLVGTDYVRATTKQNEDKNTYSKDASNNYTKVRSVGGPDLVLNGEQELFTLEGITPINPDGSTVTLTAGTNNYYKLTPSTGDLTLYSATGSESDAAETYYLATDVATKEQPLDVKDYTGTCYTDILPRYFMVIPSAVSPATPTNISVKIKYHVVTDDPKLDAKVSDVTNEITKTISLQLLSGKSYNLKMILGLTSVKLDASVADWQVADDAEVYLPQNNE